MTLILLVVIVFCLTSCAGSSPMDELVHRVIPEYEDQIYFEEIPSENSNDYFQLSTENNHLKITGNNTTSLAFGLNWYLKYYCNVSLNASCESQKNLPDVLPLPKSVERHETRLTENLYMNYCTFGYSTVFWDWSRWEKELDMMALNGVTLPMAVVGTELVWRNTLKRFGYTDDEILEYLVGPAYMPWFLMGNIYGTGGKMPEEWFNRQEKLQKKIVSRMRELGMKPIFHGFVGVVPVNLDEKFPEAKTISQGKWCGCPRPDVLLPNTELFSKMASVWYEEYEKLFGMTDYWGGDLFHEGGSVKGINLAEAAQAVQNSMLKANPNATWILQSWGGNPKKKLLDGLDKKHTLIVDLCAEYWTRWKDRKAFGGFPWLWSHVTNYGGNVGLHGRLPNIAEGPIDGLSDPNASPTMKGIGSTPEGVDVNPVVFDLINEMRWRKESPDLHKWLDSYSHRRYGLQSVNLEDAWGIFLDTAYGSYNGNRRPSESVFCAPPSLKGKRITASAWSQCRIFYNPDEYAKGVALFLKEADKLSSEETYKHDAVDFVRQYISNLGKKAYYNMIDAFKTNNIEEFEKWSNLFLNLILDQDKLLSSHQNFYVGTWIDRALNASNNVDIQNYYEWNARLLIGTWLNKRGALRDYAHKEWGGMLKDYYYPRWEKYIQYLSLVLRDVDVVEPDLYPMEFDWTKSHNRYEYNENANPVKVAKDIFDKYYEKINTN